MQYLKKKNCHNSVMRSTSRVYFVSSPTFGAQPLSTASQKTKRSNEISVPVLWLHPIHSHYIQCLICGKGSHFFLELGALLSD